MNKNEIIQIQGMEYKEMTKQLLNKCALATLIPSKVSLIGIKPNLVAPVPAEFGGTTHPEVVAGIIEYLQENGFTNLQIMEGLSFLAHLLLKLLLQFQYKTPFVEFQSM